MQLKKLAKVSGKTPATGPTVGGMGKIVVYVRENLQWPLWTKVNETKQIKVVFVTSRGIWLPLNASQRKYPLNPEELVGVVETARVWF